MAIFHKCGIQVWLVRAELAEREFLFYTLGVMMLLAFVSVQNLKAQQSTTAAIRGRITALCLDGACPQGQTFNLIGAKLTLTAKPPARAQVTATSDDQGLYELSNVQPGSYSLEVTLVGFKPYAAAVTLFSGEVLVENLQMEIAGVRQQIEVRAKVEGVAAQSVAPPATITSHQVLSVPLSQKQKFVDALPLVPGVIRTPEGELSLKGVAANQGMMLVNSTQAVDPVTGGFAIQVPLDVIQTLQVLNTPYSAQYGGFSGGLTSVQTKPPIGRWHYGLMDFIPGVRGKSGHIVGISDFTPRFFFGGPVIENKLNFSEEFSYEVNKQPIRGLAWPHNETKEQGLDSYSSIQYILSPQHLLSANVNIFPLRREFADINSLVPQTASSNYGQRGFSTVVNDSYQFGSSALLSDTFKFMQFSAYAHGQGPENMLLTPEGWSGNFFNAWTRSADQEEALSTLQLPAHTWLGRHQVQAGVAFLHRSYAGTSVSHAIQLLRENGAAAATISFLPAGPLGTQDTDVAGFIQDQWALSQRLAFELGSRLTSQSIGRRAAYAPRAGVVFSPGASGKTIIRAGAGIFYDRPPSLGGDFSENPTRVLTLLDQNGHPTGVPTVFHNVYLENGSVRLLGGGSDDLGTSPRNFTWNVQVDRELRPDIALRVSYLYSETQHLFVLNPLAEPPGRNSLLELTPGGGSHYKQFEATLRIHPTEMSFLNISYVHSRARGDLNTLANIFNPFGAPVIRPDLPADLDSDVPNRLITWGTFRLPWKLTISPVGDLHTGFPFSKVDVFQNYVGSPNSQRFPTFFSLDVKLYRDFDVRLPFFGRMKAHRLRLGVYSLNITNHYNPHDVFNNVASPNFGHFVGFEHRVDGMVIDVVP